MTEESSDNRGVRARLKAFDEFLEQVLCKIFGAPFALMVRLVQKPFGRLYVILIVCAFLGLLVFGFPYFFKFFDLGVYLFFYCAFVACAGIGLVLWSSVERLEKFEWADLDPMHKAGRLILVVVGTAIFLAPFAFVAWKLIAG